jgi:hypothetical protein
MRKQRPYRDFDLPNKHLAYERHYVPPRTRDSAEAERRRSLPRGVLLAEQQLKGLQVATTILEQLGQDGEGLRFATRWLAASGLNTAWYSYAHDAPVMRRRLKLPILATDDPEQRPSALMLHHDIVSSMRQGLTHAARIVVTTGRTPVVETYQTQVGRIVGKASLTMACFAIGDFIGYESASLDDFDLQDLARRRGLASLEDARTLAAAIGTPPSMAQLANPDSDLAVFWRRQAPQGAYEAYEAAVAA